MDTSPQPRYPGAQPFADTELSRKVFFGRDRESILLANKVIANRLVVLFARSGVGKTSLLHAGVAEYLRAERFLPLPARINDPRAGPLSSIYSGIDEACRRQAIEYIAGSQITLWHFFKTAEFWRDDILLTPALILDQFEELFTLHPELPQHKFVDQLSHLIRGVRPLSSTPSVAARAEPANDHDIVLSEAAPAVRIVIGIREDFLGQLEDLAERIPQILDYRFRLLPLTREAAAEAMVRPAEVVDPVFATRPFTFQREMVTGILDFLTRRSTLGVQPPRHDVEPFQLQLISQHVEEFVAIRQHEGLAVAAVSLEEIGGEAKLGTILKDFYQKQLESIPSRQERAAVRRLCGEYLTSPDGRRLSLDEVEIERLLSIKPATLRMLVDRRLLRADQRADSTYYELSHDSLVLPVLASRGVQALLRRIGLYVMAVAQLFGGGALMVLPAYWLNLFQEQWTFWTLLPPPQLVFVVATMLLGVSLVGAGLAALPRPRRTLRLRTPHAVSGALGGAGKSPTIAVLLSVFIAGAGQFYNGDVKKGLLMLVAAIVSGALAGGLGYLGVAIWSAIDAYKVASGQSLDDRAAGRRPASAKKPIIAVLLSVFIAGAGQFYNGDVKKGLVMLVAVIVAFILLMARRLEYFVAALYYGVVIWSIADAYYAARGKSPT